MPNRHDAFVQTENIRSFQLKLEAETDPVKRKLLADLLARESAGTPSPHGPYRPSKPD